MIDIESKTFIIYFHFLLTLWQPIGPHGQYNLYHKNGFYCDSRQPATMQCRQDKRTKCVTNPGLGTQRLKVHIFSIFFK